MASQRQHRLGGAGGDRGRDDAIAASARPAEARCVAAMPTNQLRTSFAPMTSTQRAPWQLPAALRQRPLRPPVTSRFATSALFVGQEVTGMLRGESTPRGPDPDFCLASDPTSATVPP